MKKTIYNLETIVSIEVFDKAEVYYIKYQPEKKSFWGIEHKECYRDILTNIDYTADQILYGINKILKMIIENQKVFYKPRVIITFIGDKKSVLFFDTFGEALRKAELLKTENIKSCLEVTQA